MHDKVAELTPPNPVFLGGGSTDVADISWNVPTVSMGAALAPIGGKIHTWSTAACAAAAPGQAAVIAAAKYLAATAVDLITQPERLKALKDEFKERTKDVEWKTALPDGYEPPMYEPPAWFLKKTGQKWPPSNITWPPRACRLAGEVLLARTRAGPAEVDRPQFAQRPPCAYRRTASGTNTAMQHRAPGERARRRGASPARRRPPAPARSRTGRARPWSPR